MTGDADTIPDVDGPEVLRQVAGDIKRRDHVVTEVREGDRRVAIAGEVTGLRHSSDRSTVVVVVDNRVHFIPAHHPVVIVRLDEVFNHLAQGDGRPHAWIG